MRRIPIAHLLPVLILLPTLGIAEQLTGTAKFAHASDAWMSEGSSGTGFEGTSLFGWTPEDCVSEMATATSVVTMDSGSPSSLAIPVPQYADGSYASEEEILFTLQWEHIVEYFEYAMYQEINVSWSGGPTMSMSVVHNHNGGEWVWTIKSYAFRQGSVGAAPMDFGQLKSMFE